jgi:hypothetical protein
MNLRELGRAAGERLLAAIEGRPSAGVQLLPCSLVVRESSRPRHPVIPGAGEAAEPVSVDRRATPATVPSQARVPSGQGPPAGLIRDPQRERGPS